MESSNASLVANRRTRASSLVRRPEGPSQAKGDLDHATDRPWLRGRWCRSTATARTHEAGEYAPLLGIEVNDALEVAEQNRGVAVLGRGRHSPRCSAGGFCRTGRLFFLSSNDRVE